jgi:hypothetical protein
MSSVAIAFAVLDQGGTATDLGMVFAALAAACGAGDALLTPALAALTLDITSAADVRGAVRGGRGAGGRGPGLRWGPSSATAEQRLLPSRVLARVGAFQRVSAFALGPLAFAAAGPAAGLLGARTVLGFGAVWSTVSCAFVLALPAVRMAGHEPAERPASRGCPAGPGAAGHGGPSGG